MCTTIQLKIRILINSIFFVCTRPFDQKSGSSLMFFYLCKTIRLKIRILINFFLFVHDHSTKVRGHFYSLINSFLLCVDISFAIFKAALPLYFVRSISSSLLPLSFVGYIHSSTTLTFPTLYSWKCCSYVLYAVSMAIWSPFSGAPRQCAYASSGCVQKKITLYHNFFRNLNFKNIVIFFKRACCKYG